VEEVEVVVADESIDLAVSEGQAAEGNPQYSYTTPSAVHPEQARRQYSPS
jgi:hypothetical protein